jgi:hypothetical protein
MLEQCAGTSNTACAHSACMQGAHTPPHKLAHCQIPGQQHALSVCADVLPLPLPLLLLLLLPGLRTGTAALPCLGSQASSSLRPTPTCPHGSSGLTPIPFCVCRRCCSTQRPACCKFFCVCIVVDQGCSAQVVVWLLCRSLQSFPFEHQQSCLFNFFLRRSCHPFSYED